MQRVFKRQDRPKLGDAVDRLANITAQPNSAVLIGLDNHFDHWTVLKAVGPAHLELFDSSGYARVRIANCRMSDEEKLVARREHVIRPRAVFQIRAGISG